jgi:hypothetical protein
MWPRLDSRSQLAILTPPAEGGARAIQLAVRDGERARAVDTIVEER